MFGFNRQYSELAISRFDDKHRCIKLTVKTICPDTKVSDWRTSKWKPEYLDHTKSLLRKPSISKPKTLLVNPKPVLQTSAHAAFETKTNAMAI